MTEGSADSVARPGGLSAVRSTALGLIGVVAIGLAAATVRTADQPDRRGPIGFPGPGDGGASQPSLDVPAHPVLFEVPKSLIGALAAILTLSLGYYVAVHASEALRRAVAVALWFGILWLVIVGLLLFVGSGSFYRKGTTGPGEDTVDGPADPDGKRDGGRVPGGILVLLLLAVSGIAVLLAVRTVPDGRTRQEEGGDTDPARSAAIRRAAGRAATRLAGSGSVDNEVYRAWREMTGFLDVSDPETTTPGEFASVAVAAGLDPADVEELTDLFEAVRYGGTAADEALERRALSVLRRIESAYAREDEAGAPRSDT